VSVLGIASVQGLERGTRHARRLKVAKAGHASGLLHLLYANKVFGGAVVRSENWINSFLI
jgi:hypothetical protein